MGPLAGESADLEGTQHPAAAELSERKSRKRICSLRFERERAGMRYQLAGTDVYANYRRPFKAADWALSRIASETKVVIIDMHAEATAEKMALAWHLDGRASAVIGTHTHIPTSDARILPKGTAYITDVGMSGPYDSVIGMKKEIAIRRFQFQTPYKFELAEHDVRMCAVYIQVDRETGKAMKIEQVIFPSFM